MSDLTGALRSALGHVSAARATATTGSVQHDHLDHAALDLTHALGIAETEGQHVAWSRYQAALEASRLRQGGNASHVEEAGA